MGLELKQLFQHGEGLGRGAEKRTILAYLPGSRSIFGLIRDAQGRRGQGVSDCLVSAPSGNPQVNFQRCCVRLVGHFSGEQP
jgi:hypothetical protein